MKPINPVARLSIRNSIERITGQAVVGTATANGAAATTLTDTYGLAKFDTTELAGWNLQINTTVSGGAAVGQKSWGVSIDTTTKVLTIAPAVDQIIKATQTYELIKPPYTVDDINDLINQAIRGLSNNHLQDQISSAVYTENSRYEYTLPSGYKGIYRVEYCQSGDEVTLHDCESVWTGATNVTVTLDSTMQRRGAACNKFAVAAGVAAGALIATVTIDSKDLSGKDTVEFWIYSSIAQTAAALEFVMDDTAGCVSVLETLSLPALTAATWYRCVLTLDNPHLDTAIISIGIKQEASTDVGACTLWIDHVICYNAGARVFKMLHTDYWDIADSKLKIKTLGVTGTDRCLRLFGYRIPAVFTDDTTNSEIDPEYLIDKVSGQLLMKARSPDADYYLKLAEVRMKEMENSPDPLTRWL
jgi:hypothetical protein